MPYWLYAQEQEPPERLSPAEEGTASLEISSGLTAAQKTALAAANIEIERLVAARNQPVSENADVEAVSVEPHSSGGYELIFRYRIDWVEWSHSQILPTSDAGFVADVAAAAGSVDLSPLDVTILTRAEADHILKACSALLSPIVKPLRPPFRHRLTNVYWDPQAAVPYLQSSARIPGTENDCVRADLNLVTGQSTCRDMACAVR